MFAFGHPPAHGTDSTPRLGGEHFGVAEVFLMDEFVFYESEVALDYLGLAFRESGIDASPEDWLN